MTNEEMLAEFEAASPEARARALRIAEDMVPFMARPAPERSLERLRLLAAEVLIYS